MKSNFALSLSFDGLRLMHRVTGGWHLVGEVALDDPDMTGALARLRDTASQLEPSGLRTKLLIPNDQIKYLALDTTRAEDADVRAALDGATPYAVADLAYDFAKGGGRTYIAAVARETLDEAQQFAGEHGFNPTDFAAVPEPFTFVGEANFGGLDGQPVEREDDAVVVIGVSPAQAVPVATPEPAPVDTPEPDTPAPDLPPAGVTADAPDAPMAQDVRPDDAAPAPVDTATVEVFGGTLPSEPVADLASEPAPPPEPETLPESPAEPEAEAPVFSSRLRAERAEAAPVSPPPAAPPRAEPAISRPDQPSLAVPTGAGAAPSGPSIAAPSRDAAQPQDAPAATAPLHPTAPEPDTAPPVTGEAATAISEQTAIAAAPLTANRSEPRPPQEPAASAEGAAAKALGAVGAVGGAVGGMFASRRMAKAAQSEAEAPEAQSSSRSVFGARKKPKPKPVVGGKPRFLGLILTAILLLFLLAIAAFAALSEEGLAGWFRGGDDTQVAATAPEIDTTTGTMPAAASEVAAAPETGDVTTTQEGAQTQPAPTAPVGGQVLTPEEAQRIYAATGVWQKAPRIPLIPRTTSLDGMMVDVVARPVTRVPASPLADAGSVAGDAVIPTPVDPPAPSVVFDFDERGLVVATPQGAVTPDGILVIAGRPALNPPTRPGTVAPEVTPLDQLASMIPEDAAPVTDAPEDVLVIAGAPQILPPARPGTVAPPAAAVQPDTVPEAAPEAPAADIPEGLNLIAGPPPVLPPVRPGTQAPQAAPQADDTPLPAQTAPSLRPLIRPASITQAAAAARNAPVLGDLNVAEAAAFRPRTRPAGLAPDPTPEPEQEPEPEQQAEAPQAPTLQIAPEIAAAVAEAAARPDPFATATRLAIPNSLRPDTRPRNMARIVARANEAQQRAATQVAAVAPRAVAPSGPTGGSVAQNATLENAINLRELNLIGIYGGSGDRRALIRLGNGRYQRVTVGDRLDGGRVTAISATALSYDKRGRSITLQVPR